MTRGRGEETVGERDSSLTRGEAVLIATTIDLNKFWSCGNKECERSQQ